MRPESDIFQKTKDYFHPQCKKEACGCVGTFQIILNVLPDEVDPMYAHEMKIPLAATVCENHFGQIASKEILDLDAMKMLVGAFQNMKLRPPDFNNVRVSFKKLEPDHVVH